MTTEELIFEGVFVAMPFLKSQPREALRGKLVVVADEPARAVLRELGPMAGPEGRWSLAMLPAPSDVPEDAMPVIVVAADTSRCFGFVLDDLEEERPLLKVLFEGRIRPIPLAGVKDIVTAAARHGAICAGMWLRSVPK